jgi:hypothetical protein
LIMGDSVPGDATGGRQADEAWMLRTAAAGREALEAVAYLRHHLGDAFVNWILADPGSAMSPEQANAAVTTAAVLRNLISNQPSIPIELISRSLVVYRPEWGTTFINYLRNQTAQGEFSRPADYADRLLNSLVDLAIEGYGELLLPSYLSEDGLDWGSHFRTPAGREVVAAIRDEGIFPLAADDTAAGQGSNGDLDEDIGRSFQPLMYGCGIISTAWSLAKLQVGVPSLDELIQRLPDALASTRSILRGQSTSATAVISFTGIRLPEGVQISGTWGQIRPARAEDHPGMLKAMTQKRTTTTTEAGEQVEITDAGDVISKLPSR